MKNLIKILLPILFLVSCEKQITIEQPELDLKGKWIMVDYPQFSFTMKDSTIEQVGFPLVTGDQIIYKTDKKFINCTYRNIIQNKDSFSLEILEQNNSNLKLRMYKNVLVYELYFQR